MAAVMEELDHHPRKSSEVVVEEIVRLEKKIFPKHESLAKSFHGELRKKNSGLIYARLGEVKGEEEIVGYVMYSWISSLCASIAKLAGAVLFFALLGIFGLLMQCTSDDENDSTTSSRFGSAGGQSVTFVNVPFLIDCPDSGSGSRSNSGEGVAIAVLVIVIILAIIGIIYGIFAATVGLQRILQRRYHILTRESLRRNLW